MSTRRAKRIYSASNRTDGVETDWNVSSAPPTPPTSPPKRGIVANPGVFIDWSKTVIIQCIDEEGIQKEFIVHKDLITQYSPHYFSPMFGGDFQEGQAQSVVLDEIPSVASFGLFVHWLYTQSIQGTGPSAMDLVNIWILADKALIPTLQNQVIEEFAKLEIEQVPTQLFPRVYQQQVWEGSALRALVVDMCVGQIGKLKIDETFPREMLIDIVRAGAELLPTKATKLSKEKVKRYLIPEESLD